MSRLGTSRSSPPAAWPSRCGQRMPTRIVPGDRDGDFGYSMARGFELVLSDFDTFDRSDIGTFLKRIAVVITGRIGGTSGPIWGTAFIRAGANAAGKTELTTADTIGMLRAAIEGIKQREAVDGHDALVAALDGGRARRVDVEDDLVVALVRQEPEVVALRELDPPAHDLLVPHGAERIRRAVDDGRQAMA